MTECVVRMVFLHILHRIVILYLSCINEWSLSYIGQCCGSCEKRARALSRKIPQAKVRRMHAFLASVGTGLPQALRLALVVNALGRQRIRPV